MNVQIADAINRDINGLEHGEIKDVNNTSTEFRYTVLKYFAKTTQFISWIILFPLFHTFFNLKIRNRERLKNVSTPFIIISNHISFYDSFVLRLIVGPFTNKLPFRFMAVRRFNNFYLNLLASLWIVDFIYAVFGVFVVEPGRGINKNLEEAQRIIRNGGNVVIYTEGSIVHSDTIARFKVGAVVLAQNTNTPILPISMRLGKSGIWGREFIINIGDKIEIDNNIPAKIATDNLRDRVLELYNTV